MGLVLEWLATPNIPVTTLLGIHPESLIGIGVFELRATSDHSFYIHSCDECLRSVICLFHCSIIKTHPRIPHVREGSG